MLSLTLYCFKYKRKALFFCCRRLFAISTTGERLDFGTQLEQIWTEDSQILALSKEKRHYYHSTTTLSYR